MKTEEAVTLAVDMITVLATRAPGLIEALQKDPDWTALMGKVGAASGTPTETEKAAEAARRRVGI